MKKMLTGIQPTGQITLGNYLGAIKKMVMNQEKYDSYIFIADMHAITVSQDPIALRNNIKSLVALYIACGINPNKNTIFIQSENEYHANVSWLLECSTYYGELSRMTQFKDKSLKHANFSVGLLTYPVLMASDILIYDTDFVPVGKDQTQHLELARDIAIRFNKKYGETFKIPQPASSFEGNEILIKNLQTPTIKMSKSSENKKGVIMLLEDLNSVRKKIMSATTDSEMKICYDIENKPGISNLMQMYSLITDKSLDEIEKEFEGKNYGEFKKVIADEVVKILSDIQKKYNEIINSDEINKILDNGRDLTRKIAKKKFELMKDKMGLAR